MKNGCNTFYICAGVRTALDRKRAWNFFHQILLFEILSRKFFSPLTRLENECTKQYAESGNYSFRQFSTVWKNLKFYTIIDGHPKRNDLSGTLGAIRIAIFIFISGQYCGCCQLFVESKHDSAYLTMWERFRTRGLSHEFLPIPKK